jgi:transposase InsO family protein
VTRHPTANWAAQRVVEACAWDRDPPRYLLRDRDGRYGKAFDRRQRGLGVRQLRTPPKAPRANALAERWVRSARTGCLDHLCIEAWPTPAGPAPVALPVPALRHPPAPGAGPAELEALRDLTALAEAELRAPAV